MLIIIHFLFLFLILTVYTKECIYKNETVMADNISETCTIFYFIDSQLKCQIGDTLTLQELKMVQFERSEIADCYLISFRVEYGPMLISDLLITYTLLSTQLQQASFLHLSAKNISIKGNFQITEELESAILVAQQFTLIGCQIQSYNLAIYSTEFDIELINTTITTTARLCKFKPFQSLIGFLYSKPFIEKDNYHQDTQISINSTIKLLGLDSDIDVFYNLLANYEANYTFIMLSNQQIMIDQDSFLKSSQIGIFAQGMDVYGQIICDYGCQANQGPGKGVYFFYTQENCLGSGGSSAGYGGIGVVEGDNKNHTTCHRLANAVQFKDHLHPSVSGLGGSGGGGLKGGSGGGYIKIQLINQLFLEGNILAQGESGESGGGGGSIHLYAKTLSGNGKISSSGGDSYGAGGEGGGGFITIQFWDYNTEDQQEFLGEIDVSKGYRMTAYQDYNGTNGSIIMPGCKLGYQMINLKCVKCKNGNYSFNMDGYCTQCPGQADTQIQIDQIQCHHLVCDDFYQDPLKFLTSFILSLYGILAYIFLFIILISGYIMRRIYRLKEQPMEQLPFDFEHATKKMVLDNIITDSLKRKDDISLVDLLYHAHRITLNGVNSYEYPWYLPLQPPEEIQYFIDPEEYKRFAIRINKLAEWKPIEKIQLIILMILYYPFYWLKARSFKKKKYKAINNFVKEGKFSRMISIENDQVVKLKITKSADYTLLHLDIFNYKNSDMKYFFLSCPYVVFLSGEGNFIRPYYLCESDPFLTCLYFAINKCAEKEVEDDRYKIMENLVAHKKRMENCDQFNSFLKKFNRCSRAVDYGASQKDFLKRIRELLILCKNWNNRFFSKFCIKLDLVVVQGSQDQQISVLENDKDEKFDQFVKDLHYNLKMGLVEDTKLGIFIYDLEMELDELDDALNNKKISFNEYSHNNTVDIEEDEEFNINQLKENYLIRNSNEQNSMKSIIHTKQGKQEKQLANKKQQQKSRLNLGIKMFLCFFDWIRFQFICHRLTVYNKYTVIFLELILTFLDALFVPLFIISSFQNIFNGTMICVSYQLLFLPFVLAIPISPILGCLWISTQSYGIAKLHLIFNSMALVNLTIHIILCLIQFDENDQSLAIVIQVANLIIKMGICFFGKRILSVNIKLNKLNQQKHLDL